MTLVLGSVGIAASSSAAPAPEAATASIGGTVRTATGPVGGVKVSAYLNGVLKRSATTTSTGAYTLGSLVGGNYQLVADSATVVRTTADVVVPNATAVRNVVITVQKSAIISGFVRRPPGVVVGGAVVQAIPAGTNVSIRSTTSRSDGYYRLTDVTPGSIQVKAATNTMVGWHSATPGGPPLALTINPGQTLNGRNILVQVPTTGATLSGELRTSTNALANGSVKVYEAGGSNLFIGSFPVVNGNWNTGQLPSGSYLVLFTAPGETSEWWSDIDFMDRATPVVLNSTPVVLNARLDARSVITGRGLLPSGLPAPSNSLAVVYVAGTSQVMGVDVVDAQGRFEVGGIRVGRSYEVEVRPPSGSTLTPSLRRLVGVGGSGDHVLRPPAGTAYLFGNLSTSTSEPANGSVKLYRAGTPATFIGSYVTAHGTWVTEPVTPGNYLVMFTAPGETGEWWAEGDSIDQATAVTVGSTPVGPLHALLEARTEGTMLVRSPSGGVAPSNSLVVAYELGTNKVAGVGATDGAGHARIGGLRRGRSYEFEARPPSGSVLANSPRVLGYAFFGISFPAGGPVLQSPVGHGALTATVMGRSAIVELWRVTAAGNVLALSAPTGFDSVARFEAVPNGTYLVRIAPAPGQTPFPAEWWPNVGDPSEAVNLTFSYASRRFDVVQEVGEVNGWIYNYVGGPPWYSGNLGAVQIYATNGALLGYFSLNGSGSPSPWLAPGQYRLRFVPNGDSGLDEEWYDNADGFDAAALLTVTPGVASIVRWHLDPAPGARVVGVSTDPSQPVRPPDAA